MVSLSSPTSFHSLRPSKASLEIFGLGWVEGSATCRPPPLSVCAFCVTFVGLDGCRDLSTPFPRLEKKKHLTFSREFATAIESKQVAQQEAERQQWLVVKADKVREAAVIRAEGEAEAAKIVNAAIAESGQGLIEVRRSVGGG